jgi:hypothetical protein
MGIHQPGKGLFLFAVVPHFQDIGFPQSQHLQAGRKQSLRLVLSVFTPLPSPIVVAFVHQSTQLIA